MSLLLLVVVATFEKAFWVQLETGAAPGAVSEHRPQERFEFASSSRLAAFTSQQNAMFSRAQLLTS
jgi:hypothetical protein